MKKLILIALILGLSACSTVSKKSEGKISNKHKNSSSARSTHRDANLTDLMEAAKTHDVDTLRSLLMKGTDANVKNAEGKTAIFYSAELGCLECIQLLVRAGAKVNIRDKRGKLPVDYLKDSPQKAEILKLLKS